MEAADNLKWEWPDELDALKAAPLYHKLLFENDLVRVIDAFIPAGETTEVHTHRWPASLYVISWSTFIRYDADGNEIFNSRNMSATIQPGTALWSEPLAPHALKNTGTDALHIISVEIKK